MKAAKIPLRDAEKMKSLLLEQGMLDLGYLPCREGDCIYFPLLDSEIPEDCEFDVVERDLKAKHKKIVVDDLLREFLNEDEMKLVPRSQEIIGNILVLEIPDQLIFKEKQIAEAYLKTVHNIKTVVKKIIKVNQYL